MLTFLNDEEINKIEQIEYSKISCRRGTSKETLKCCSSLVEKKTLQCISEREFDAILHFLNVPLYTKHDHDDPGTFQRKRFLSFERLTIFIRKQCFLLDQISFRSTRFLR